VNCWTVCKR